ncbi:FkbM family methyltransferase [Roseivirga misakiensis]|uniref:Methyltransferase FkbM domain-containing protein n=1 Tax=Roseivirga misakiensis TaxID=1563681 RepID=A0A1E5T1N8_9BACT|nr:FkbM family methyltransferase [Roseivirga misakiensis]OEK05217.1 hypothetical protein BFP71_17595 [Roseivirga misakiensis]
MTSDYLISDLKIIKHGAQVVLFGAGASGVFVFKKIRANRSDVQVLAFIDDLKTGEISKIPVQKFNEIPDDVIVLVTTSYWRDVVQRLEQTNLTFYVVDLLSGESETKKIRRVLQNREIHFYTPNKYLLQVSENFETIENCTTDWINSFETDAVFYDVGASSGIYAIYAAVVKGAIAVAVEPDAQNFSILEMNHYLNRKSMVNRFVSLNLGLGDTPSVLGLRCQDYLAGAHGKVFDMSNRDQQKEMRVDHIQYTLVETLDHLLSRYKLPAPEYMKIDVDGAEMNVLNGAADLLQGNKVKQIMIEVEVNEFEAVSSRLSSFGFKLVDRFSIREIIGGEISGIHNYLFEKGY